MELIFTAMEEKPGPENAVERLKTLRIKAGQDPEGLADQIGITADWYLDLEKEPGEMEAGLDMTQLRKLAILLNVGMAYLITGEPIPDTVPTLTYLEVARGLRLRLGQANDIPSLEAKIGWDLAAFLKNPESDGWEQRAPFFRDTCRELEMDWRGVLRYCESFREE